MRRRGMVLVALLVIAMLVTMLAGALLNLNRQWLTQVAWQRDKTQALEMARGGLNHLIHRLTYDSHFAQPLSVPHDRSGYACHFDSTTPYYSVNNLSNSGVSSTINFRGNPVAPGCADLVVLGHAGQTQVRCHAVVRHGVSFLRAAGAVGQIQMVGDVSVDAIDSAASPTPVVLEGGLFSQFASTLAQSALDWDNLGGSAHFTLGPDSRLLTVPPAVSGASGFSNSLISALPGSSLDQQASGEIPTFDVARLVTNGASSPAPDGAMATPGGYTLTSPGVKDQRYVNGNLTVLGDVVLTDGTLLVHGDLTINGGIKGKGAIYVDGDVHVLGGNSSVLSNQASGAALMSSGDIQLQGLDSRGYLETLAATYPSVHDNLSAFNTTLSGIANAADSHSFGSAFWLTNQLTREYYLDPTPPAGRSKTGYWVNSIRAPNGHFPDGNSDGDIPGLVQSIRSSLGSAYASDVNAQRVVKALEEVHYEFRRNLDGCPGTATVVDNQVPGVPDFAAYSATTRIHYGVFDDVMLPMASRTLDSQQSVPGYDPVAACEGVRGWFRNNPLDLSWIGKSYFQGILYSEGNLRVDTQFKVLGGMAARGKITLSNGAHLVFVDEYRKLGGAYGPISVLSYEEL